LVDAAEEATCFELSLRAEPKALPNPDPKRPPPPPLELGFSSSFALGSALNELCSLKPPEPRPEIPVDCWGGGNAVSLDDEVARAPPEPNGDLDEGCPKTLPPLGVPPRSPKPDFEAKLAKPPAEGAAGEAVEVEVLPNTLLTAEGPSPPSAAKPLV
jgi:hypothetical protein